MLVFPHLAQLFVLIFWTRCRFPWSSPSPSWRSALGGDEPYLSFLPRPLLVSQTSVVLQAACFILSASWSLRLCLTCRCILPYGPPNLPLKGMLSCILIGGLCNPISTRESQHSNLLKTSPPGHCDTAGPLAQCASHLLLQGLRPWWVGPFFVYPFPFSISKCRITDPSLLPCV